MTWHDKAAPEDGYIEDKPRSGLHRKETRAPGTLRARAARRGAAVLAIGIVVPLAVIGAHLASLNETAEPGSQRTSLADRPGARRTTPADLPATPTPDPTELPTPAPESSAPGASASPVPTSAPPLPTGTTQPPAAAPPSPAGNPAAPAPPPPQPLLVDNFDGNPSWSGGKGRNDLGQVTQCEVFASCAVTGDALVLRYDDDGWFGSWISRSVADYTYLVLRIRGQNGGEERDIRLTLGGVRSMLDDLTAAGGGHPHITTSYTEVRLPLATNGINASNPGEFQLDFWHGGDSTVYIDEIRFE